MTEEEIDDLIGERHGSLVIENYMYSGHKGTDYFSCLCDCGNHITVTYNTLIKGLKKTCGCGISRAVNPNDHIGKVYGQWTIIDFVGSVEQSYIRYKPEPIDFPIKHYFYLCRCTCGLEKKATLNNIRHSAKYGKCTHQ